MNRTRLSGLLLLLGVSFASAAYADEPAPSDPFEGKKRCHINCDPAGNLQLDLNLGMPVSNDGAGVIPDISAAYRVFRYLDVGLGFSYVVADTGDGMPGNFRLEASSMWSSSGSGGPVWAIGGRLGLGFNPFDVGSDEGKAHAAAVGLVASRNPLFMAPASLVLQPQAFCMLSLGGSTLEFLVGPAFQIPTQDGDTRDTTTGFVYQVSVNGGFGGRNGLFLVNVGLRGVKDFDGLEENNASLDLGLGFWLRSLQLLTKVGVSVPIDGLKADQSAIVGISFAWKTNFFGEDPSPLYIDR
ncbi:MAG: hypothetical protein GYA21_05635 [Myxococcales bacterium]|nr:hypothetical protein [Myxococcales bacterium]